MQTNADMTLYIKGSDGKYTRRTIKNIFWNEVKESNTTKSGLTNADSVKVFVQLDNMQGISVSTGDITVKGLIDFEIDNTSQSTISSSLATLKKNHAFVTVTSCDAKLFGSSHMQHYVLSCK